MSRYSNSRKDNLLTTLAKSIIENSGIEQKCKFNFAYFDTNSPASDFSDWDFENICDFLHKLKEFTKEPLKNWLQPQFKHNSPLEIYNNFPPKNKTMFTYPPHVPANAKWARFRLSGEARLIGFLIPDELHNHPSDSKNEYCFDKNTFYVVFLDLNHKFWLSEKKHT